MKIKIDLGVEQFEGIRIDLLIARLKDCLDLYPEAIAILNEKNQCLDLYRILNNGGDSEYITQIMIDGHIWPRKYPNKESI